MTRGQAFARSDCERDVGESDLFQEQVSEFWANLTSLGGYSSPTLIERVWVANRCQHMNANAISTMPLRHFGGREPAWVANPDPAWYGSGIVDAMYSVVDSFYGWGDAFLYITSRWADGYPSGFTVLNPPTSRLRCGGIRVSLRAGVLTRTTSSRSRATPKLGAGDVCDPVLLRLQQRSSCCCRSGSGDDVLQAVRRTLSSSRTRDCPRPRPRQLRQPG